MTVKYILSVGITSTPKSAKTIRVCTVQDIKSACPETCVKPKIRDPLTIWGLTKKCISLGFRTAIVGSVVYWTWYIGLWGDATDTEKLYVSMKNTVLQKEDNVEVQSYISGFYIFKSVKSQSYIFGLYSSKSVILHSYTYKDSIIYAFFYI